MTPHSRPIARHRIWYYEGERIVGPRLPQELAHGMRANVGVVVDQQRSERIERHVRVPQEVGPPLGVAQLLRWGGVQREHEIEATSPSSCFARSTHVQRAALAALAAEVSRVLPGFGDVTYPDWSSLLSRLYRDGPKGLVVVLAEFTDLVAASSELPSVLRNHVDTSTGNVAIAISGSSQSMMHSLVLDSLQPLFGRSTELLRLTPMWIGWMARALSVEATEAAVEAWSVIGGVPRYWELFQGRALWEAVAERILDPQGPLHPRAGRTLYRIADPFLRFLFHFVEPNRSQLEAGNLDLVLARVRSALPGFVGPVWEDLARASVPRLGRFAGNYQPAARWWGSTPTGSVELDIVARHTDGQRLLVAEAKRTVQSSEADGLLRHLETHAARVPELAGQPHEAVLFVLNGGTKAWNHPRVVGPAEVIEALGGEAKLDRRTDVCLPDP